MLHRGLFNSQPAREPRLRAQVRPFNRLQCRDRSFLTHTSRFNPLFGAPVDEQKCQRLIGELEHMLSGYERILKTQKYLGGDVVTLADLFHVPWGYIVHYEQVIAVFDGYPSVARWWQDISNRPAWRATLKAI